MNSKTLMHNWQLGLAFVLGILVYLIGIGGSFYQDDFSYVFSEPQDFIWSGFTTPEPFNPFYRPMQTSMLALSQMLFGWNTIPVHVLQIFLHALGAVLVYRFLLRLDFSTLQGFLGAGYMLVSQASVNGVVGNDTLSQVGGTIFGYAAIWFLFRAYFDHQSLSDDTAIFRNRHYYFALLAFTISLFMKESSAALIVIVGFVMLIKHIQSRKFIPALVRATLDALPFLLLFLVYITLWFFVTQQAEFADRYQFAFGINVIQNIGLLTFSNVVPVSSVTTFIALSERNYALLVPILAATGVVVITVAYGLWLTRRPALIGILLVVLFMIYLPVLPLAEVGELYGYGGMPVTAMLFGMGAGKLIEVAAPRKRLRMLLVAATALLFTSHILSVQSKAAMMRENGEQALALIANLKAFSQAIPQDTEQVIVVVPDRSYVAYSVFVVDGFDLLWDFWHLYPSAVMRDFAAYKYYPHTGEFYPRTGDGPPPIEENCVAITYEGPGFDWYNGEDIGC